jgi:hypothetical protein
MKRSTLRERDEQADDLDLAASEMQTLAEQLRTAPVTLAELAAELGAESVDRLAYQLGADVYLDDRGFRVVTRQRARVLLAERAALEEQRRQVRERNDAVGRAAGERNDAENKAALDYIDARQRRYGDPVVAHRLDVLAVLGAAVHDEAMATADEREQAWLDEMAERDRTAKRFDSHGNLIG